MIDYFHHQLGRLIPRFLLPTSSCSALQLSARSWTQRRRKENFSVAKVIVYINMLHVEHVLLQELFTRNIIYVFIVVVFISARQQRSRYKDTDILVEKPEKNPFQLPQKEVSCVKIGKNLIIKVFLVVVGVN